MGRGKPALRSSRFSESLNLPRQPLNRCEELSALSCAATLVVTAPLPANTSQKAKAGPRTTVPPWRSEG
jgi:hypothetical protein